MDLGPLSLEDTTELRQDLAILLHAEVSAMNVDNFVVRPKRRLVEKYGKREAWTQLEGDALAELRRQAYLRPTRARRQCSVFSSSSAARR